MTIDANRLRALLQAAPHSTVLHRWKDGGSQIYAEHIASRHESTVALAAPVGYENSSIEIEPGDLELLLAAVNTLPELLAVFEAVCAWRDSMVRLPDGRLVDADDGSSEPDMRRPPSREVLCVAIDAARGVP